MEGSASAPTHPHIELEPPEWQPRALRAGARGLCGAVAFFMVAFVFAYFYLRAQDPDRDWKIGHVSPSVAFGLIILLVLIASAVLLNMAARRPELTVSAGGAALGLALLSIVLQVVQWTTLGFGPESGGYASVFVGWTAFYTVLTLACAYWIETQVASIWRLRRGDVDRPVAAGVPTPEPALAEAGIRACSFFWTFYVGIGVITFVILYLLK